MSARQLRDEVVTLFLAGHETTALTLSWSFSLLARHKAARECLLEEVDRELAGRPPAIADLPRLRYTEAVVHESLRLFPPAYVIGREAAVDCEVGGIRIPAGTTLLLSPWVLHRDRRTFEAPLEFRPERWLDGLASRLPRGAYLPFGGGPRLCIGQSFALTEAILVLASISRRFRLEPDAEAPVPFPSITLRPRSGVWMRTAGRGRAHYINN